MQIGDDFRRWVPVYGYEAKAKNGLFNRERYQIPDAVVYECPKSVILRDGGWAMEIVNQYLLSERMEKSFGEVNFGPNVNEWPAWVEDVISVMKRQQSAIKEAREEHIARTR